MSSITYYTPSHEWIAIEGNVGTVGITEYAEKELGDLVYVELPKVGMEVTAGEAVCVLESTKAAVDVYSPMSGRVVAVNGQEKKSGTSWLFKIELKNPQEIHTLLSSLQYQKIL